MEYYESRLEPAERKFYAGILAALQSRLSFVKSEGITEEQSFQNCILAVQYDHPELFYVDFWHYQYVPYEDGWELRAQYLYDSRETARKQKAIDEVVGRICLEISKRGLTSLYQQCGWIHSYLVRNCVYDMEALEDSEKRRTAYTIEGPLLEKTGVCLGIALAYRLICRRCGIEAIVVKGVSLRPGTKAYELHAWNLIRAGENTAQVDVTWDMCLTFSDWPIRYDYFFLPDIEMMRDHQYVGYPLCRKLRMSYFERSGSQFESLQELGGWIGKQLRKGQDEVQPGVCFFQFKLVRRKESEETVREFVRDTVRTYTNRSYSYAVSPNGPQSVFSCRIEIM